MEFSTRVVVLVFGERVGITQRLKDYEEVASESSKSGTSEDLTGGCREGEDF